MLDGAGRIVSWNTSSETMIGYSSKEVVGKNYSIFFSKGEKDRKIPQKALAVALKKGSYMAEGIRVRKDGSHFWSRSFLTLVQGDEKGATMFVLITQD